MAVKKSSVKPLHGNRRSHSCRATKHAQKANYQRIKTENGKIEVYTARELRTMRKNSQAAA